MGFNIADQVEPLDYDFTTARPLPDALKGAKGVVPEPSPDEVDAFFGRYYELHRIVSEADQKLAERAETEPAETTPARKKTAKAKAEPTDLAARLEAWRGEPRLDEERKLVDKAFVDLLDDFCKGSPTRAQIEALGHRARTRFLGWLMNELMDPKGSMNGTAASPSRAG